VSHGRGIAAATAAVALCAGVFGVVLGGRSPAAGRASGEGHVRVNQVGYPRAADKRAYLMASVRAAGAPYTVTDGGGRTVASGRVGPDLGRWSRRFPHVYPIDFTRVRRSGTFRIVVAGPAPAAARITIGNGAPLYAGPLRNALSFYRVQRDGPDIVRSPLRTAASHLNDARAMTYRTPKVDSEGAFPGDLSPLGVRIDASGGWWDAGDYLKFVHATAYTDAVLLMGVRDLPAQMGARAGPADFTAEAGFGARWLLRMWDDRTRTLYYQVGIGNGNDATVSDHDIWRLPQADDTYGGHDPAYRYIRHRPVFRAGPPGSPVSPNLAGRDSAALALCYQVFKRSDPRMARSCLVSAEHLFDIADTAPKGHLTTAIPFDFYPETEWRDDLELGAAELARALELPGAPRGIPHRDPRHYLRLAARWAHAYIHGPNDAADTLNLYDVSALAHADLIRAMRGRDGGLAVTRAGLLADLRRQLAVGIDQGRTDPFGFGYGWAQYDTTTHGTGLAVTASLYDELSGSHRYAALGMRWLGNVLGANAWGSSFIVGDGRVYPHCMQHQVANIAGSLDGSAPVLAGAAVEGPNSEATRGRLPHMRACPAGGGDRFARFNSTAVYRDNVESYSTVEPAIDLTATSPLAFALAAAGRL
jgi:endoglucanase